jgi:hypothetical protein
MMNEELFAQIRQAAGQMSDQDKQSVLEAFRRADEETKWILNNHKD